MVDIKKIEEQLNKSEEPVAKESVDQFEVSVDLQRDILNLILTDRNFLINSLSVVDSEYFVDFAHQNICQICQNYFKEYNSPITIEVLNQEINNKFQANRQLPRFLSEIDIISERTEEAFKAKDYLKKAVINFAKAQAMKSAIMRSVDLIPTQQYEEIEQIVKEALLVAPDLDLGTDVFEGVEETYMKILADMEGERFITGWGSVDRILKGGLGRKEVGMIFANSGVGKSLWLCKAAVENMVKGKNVLYITCEMSEERVVTRLHSMLSGIPIDKLVTKIPDLRKRLDNIKSIITGQLKIKEFSAGASTITDFRAFTNQLYSYTGFKPDLILLDYIDEVKCSNTRLDTYTSQYHTLREFRAWMTDDDLCGFTATQANRQGKSVKIITEGEIGDSYAKIRVVDAAWSLNQNDVEKLKDVARLFSVKHRNAKSGHITCVKINPDTLKMSEIPELEYEQILGTNAPVEVVGEESI